MTKMTRGLILANIKTFLVRFLVVISYSFIGAAAFYFIEQPNEIFSHQIAADNMTNFIMELKLKLHNNTSIEQLLFISKDIQTLAADITVQKDLRTIDQYFGWVYFCLTTIMTIGKYLPTPVY